MTDLELYFKYRCEKGLEKRGLSNNPKYRERLDYEIQVITDMGYINYFLIVSDFITWAIHNGIPVGPGRGSAAGSLASYCLEITHLDPIKYGLIFERFLNPDRISYPDIDVDFCKERRLEVVEYVRQKYGEDKVAHIGTFGTMKAKASIRDVASALGLPYALGDKLSRMTLEPIAGKEQSLKTCYEKVPELNNIRHGKDSDGKRILYWAEQVENRTKSFGTHAAGVIISEEKIASTIPLYIGKDRVTTSQFEMNTVEEVGLIKFDFLGLDALTTIDRCVKMVSKRHGIDIDPLQIPVDDPDTYKTLQTGNVAGVFQMEGSSGIRDLVVQIRPTCLEDIAVLVAIYRPGPLGSTMLQHYLKVRAGQANPHYIIPELEPILGSTDGMLIYQEQILEICKQLAGYSLGEADLMRRAVGKKKEKEMAAQHEKFIGGMQDNGISLQDAESIWKDIENFASYGFNLAHAACYGYIGYQTAWLKTHYPLEFMCSCLISDSDNTDKVIGYIDYCREHNTNVLGPDINESEYDFSITNDNKSIRFGLGAIKNLGKPVQEIIEEREANGDFLDIMDFCNRVNLSKVNKLKLESLVLAGAFDNCGDHNRKSMLGAIEDILRYKNDKKSYDSKMLTYLKRMAAYEDRQQAIIKWMAMSKEEQKEARARGEKKLKPFKLPVKPEEPILPSIPSKSDITSQDRLVYEKELLGYFVSGHPLDNVREKSNYTISKIKEESTEYKLKDGDKVSVVAIPNVIKTITTKKHKKRMAYITLEDKTGTIEAVILPHIYTRIHQLVDVQTPAFYNVSLDIVEGDEEKIIKLKVTNVQALQSVRDFQNRPIRITVPIANASNAAKVITENKGLDHRVQLSIQTDEGNTWEIGTFFCRGDRASLEKLLEELI